MTFEEWWINAIGLYERKDLARAAWNAALSASTEATAGEPKSMRCPRGGGSCSVEPCIEEGACTLHRVADTAPPPASGQKLTELLEDARDYVIAFTKDAADGHIAAALVEKIDAALGASDSATTSDKEG